jgi:hypothetical protein
MRLNIYLSWIHPLHHSPSSSLLRTISISFIRFSYIDTKYIHHIHPHSPFPCAHLLPLAHTSRRKLFFLPALHYFLIKCILVVQGSFALALQVWIYHTLIKLTPPLLTHSLSSCFPNIGQLTLQCIIFIYKWVLSIFFIL